MYILLIRFNHILTYIYLGKLHYHTKSKYTVLVRNDICICVHMYIKHLPMSHNYTSNIKK